MCPPVIAAAGLAMTVLSTAMSVKSSMDQSKAAQAQANYQAAVGRNNQMLAGRAADDARLRGEETARREASKTKQLQGRQRAVLASNGVLVDQGSALDITSDTAQIGKLDELTIRSNAEREALGYEAQGMNFQAGSNLNAAASANAMTAGTSSAFGTVLTGAGNVASKWYEFSKAGMFSSGGATTGQTYQGLGGIY